jgi:glutamate-1-semialdehyde aminotransferase
MCSTQWDTPVNPGASSFEPTRYHPQTVASGAGMHFLDQDTEAVVEYVLLDG